MVPFERALVSTYRPSIVTFHLSLRAVIFAVAQLSCSEHGVQRIPVNGKGLKATSRRTSSPPMPSPRSDAETFKFEIGLYELT